MVRRSYARDTRHGMETLKFVSGAGCKPVSLKSAQEHLEARVKVLTTLCKELVALTAPHERARLMSILQIIVNTDVDEESRDA